MKDKGVIIDMVEIEPGCFVSVEELAEHERQHTKARRRYELLKCLEAGSIVNMFLDLWEVTFVLNAIWNPKEVNAYGTNYHRRAEGQKGS